MRTRYRTGATGANANRRYGAPMCLQPFTSKSARLLIESVLQPQLTTDRLAGLPPSCLDTRPTHRAVENHPSSGSVPSFAYLAHAHAPRSALALPMANSLRANAG